MIQEPELLPQDIRRNNSRRSKSPCRGASDGMRERQWCSLRDAQQGRADIYQSRQALSRPNIHDPDLGQRPAQVREPGAKVLRQAVVRDGNHNHIPGRARDCGSRAERDSCAMTFVPQIPLQKEKLSEAVSSREPTTGPARKG